MNYLDVLMDHFKKRKENNHGYSLRAFARDLSLNPSTLSKVLKGQRGLPMSRLKHVTLSLKLSVKEERNFISSVFQRRGLNHLSQYSFAPDKIKTLKNDLHFKIISEWEHFAFLSLMRTKDFKPQADWVGERLMISKERVKTIIQTLLDAGFIAVDDHGGYKRCDPKITTTDDISSLALKIRHQNDFKKNITRIWSTPVENRDVCSMLFAINTKNISKAKQITRNYFKQVEALLEKGDTTEVYQLSVQLMPITKIKKLRG